MQISGRYQNRSSLKSRRRELRNDPTVAERVLWKRIRNEQLGVKFRRQYNIDYYIVDFICHSLKFIIELDGWIHDEEYQKNKDEVREKYLTQKGYTIVHYRNEQVKYDLDDVIQDIVNNIHSLSLR